MTTPHDPAVPTTPIATYPPDCPLPPRPALWGVVYPFYWEDGHKWLWGGCYYETEARARDEAAKHRTRTQLPVAVVYIPPEEPAP